MRRVAQQPRQLTAAAAGSHTRSRAALSCLTPPSTARCPAPACRRGGWYPAVHGPGNLAAKGRVPYALLSLLDVLRTFPGQVRDLERAWVPVGAASDASDGSKHTAQLFRHTQSNTNSP